MEMSCFLDFDTILSYQRSNKSLSCNSPSIYRHSNASNPPCLHSTGQEDSRLRYILRSTIPPQGHKILHELLILRLIKVGFGECSADERRTDRVAADLVVGVFKSARSGKIDDGGFAGIIRCTIRVGNETVDAGYINDTSTLSCDWVGRLGYEMGQGGF